MIWRPIEEYPEPEEGRNGKLVVGRDKEKTPYIAFKKWQDGLFYPFPGVPMFYGDQVFGFMTLGKGFLVEFMEIPE